jgi:hypothetical protein
MKKKFLFRLGAITMAFALTFNISISKNSNSSYLNLNIVSSIPTAQAVVDPVNLCQWNVLCECCNKNGIGSECVGVKYCYCRC